MLGAEHASNSIDFPLESLESRVSKSKNPNSLTVQTKLPDIKSPVGSGSGRAALSSRGASRPSSRVGSPVPMPPDAQSDLDALMARLKALDKGPSSELSAEMLRGLNRRLTELEFLLDKEDQNREKLRQAVEARIEKVEARQQAELPALHLTEAIQAVEEGLKSLTAKLKGVSDVSSQHETHLSRISASISSPEAIERMVGKAVSEAISGFNATRITDLQELEQLKIKFELSEKARLELESELSALAAKMDQESKAAAEERKIQAKIKAEAEVEAEKSLKRERDRASAVVEMMDRMEALESLVDEVKNAKPAPTTASIAVAPGALRDEEVKLKAAEVEVLAAFDEELEGQVEEAEGKSTTIQVVKEDDQDLDSNARISALEGRLDKIEKQISDTALSPPAPAPTPAIAHSPSTQDAAKGECANEAKAELDPKNEPITALAPAPAPTFAPEESSEGLNILSEKIEALASQLEEAKKIWSLAQTKQHSHLPTSTTSGLSAEFAIQNLTAHVHAVEARLKNIEKGSVENINEDPQERKLTAGNSQSRLSRLEGPQDDDFSEEKITEIIDSKVKVVDEKLKAIEELLKSNTTATDKKALAALKEEVQRQVSKLHEETARALKTTYEQMSAIEQGLSATIDELQQRLTSVLTVLVQRVKGIEGQLLIDPSSKPGDASPAIDGPLARTGSNTGKSPLGPGAQRKTLGSS